MDSILNSNLREWRVVGIHLSGAQSHRSALVRGTFSASSAWSGESGWRHECVAPVLSTWTGAPEIREIRPPIFDGQFGVSSLVVDAFIGGIGPEKDADADVVLMQAVQDLGPADFYIIDQALELPPCMDCQLSCPGVKSCGVPQVAQMNRFWESQRKQGKRLRTPQPYLDRFFDLYARHVLNWRAGLLAGEFESPTGANRAPHVSRARHLVRRLSALFGVPREKIFETQSVVSSVAWKISSELEQLRSGARLDGFNSAILKRAFAGRLARRDIWDYLVQSGRISIGANFPGHHGKGLWIEPDLFFAAMSALNLRELFAGGVFMQDDFLRAQEILLKLPLLPQSAGYFIEWPEPFAVDVQARSREVQQFESI